jgi:hypothetical protein
VVHAVIPTLGSSRQESCEFEASLDHVMNEILSQKKKKKEFIENSGSGTIKSKTCEIQPMYSPRKIHGCNHFYYINKEN